MTVLLLSLNLGAMPAVVPPSVGRLGFVPTAGDVYDDPTFVRRDRHLLQRLGYDVVDITLGASADAGTALSSVDAVFLAGGNTFYLLQQLRLSGAADVLRELVADGLPLIGASAGAVVVGPSVEPVRTLDDPTAAAALAAYDGISIVPFVPLPHSTEPLQENYVDIVKEYGSRHDIVPLRDDQGVVVDDRGRREIIASGPV